MGDVNWRRTFAISSLIFALLLVCGSIYLHLQQKHHLGRLHHSDRVVAPTAGVAAVSEVQAVLPVARTGDIKTYNSNNNSGTSIDNYNDYYNDEQSADSSVESDEMNVLENHNSFRRLLSKVETTESDVDMLPELPKNGHVSLLEVHQKISEACLQCICETTTECQPTKCAENEPCGVFRVSRPYWIDGGRLRLNGDKSGPRELGPDNDYFNCVNNAYCAARTIVNYVSRYERDCTGDGKIDCRDFIALHVLGPSGCTMRTLSPLYRKRMENCLVKFS